jgi:SNF2 family DNA or RNA helicase
MPEQPVYHSDRIYEFQVDGIAYGYLLERGVFIWDTGMGKTHAAMGVGGLAFEFEDIDLILLVAEKNKIHEWAADFAKYTTLIPFVYHGPNRLQKLHGNHDVQVLVTTYETARNDCAVSVTGPSGRGKTLANGLLLDWLLDRKVMVVYDESTKLGNRSSQLYKNHAYLLKQLRKKSPGLRVYGLTATPVERDIETAFNQFRLIAPKLMPTVGEFEKNAIKAWREIKKGNRVVARAPIWNRDYIPEFAELCKPLIIRKRKTDPDVISEFPKQIEEVRNVDLKPDHKKLYQLVEGLAWDDDGEMQDVPGLWTILRQVAGHPASLLWGRSELAEELVAGLGAQYLGQVSSAKSEALLEYLKPLVLGQGAKAMVFTFFGQSVLHALRQDLEQAGLPFFLNHGGLGASEQHETIQRFRTSDEPAVLLTSDAGARGINVPEATYVVEYESSLTHAKRLQRMNRAHRIDSDAASVHCMTFVQTGTVEQRIVDNMLARNAAQDALLGDDAADGEAFLTAADRRLMFSISRKRSK